jgi:hypothetical protein
MMSPSKALEREIGKLIKDSDALKALFGKDDVPIFTIPQEVDQLPYLIYTETTLNDWSDDTSDGCEHLVDIEIRSGTESEALIKDVQDAVRIAIDRKNGWMDMRPYLVVTIDFVSQDVARDTDGQVIRATARYRALTGGRRL